MIEQEITDETTAAFYEENNVSSVKEIIEEVQENIPTSQVANNNHKQVSPSNHNNPGDNISTQYAEYDTKRLQKEINEMQKDLREFYRISTEKQLLLIEKENPDRKTNDQSHEQQVDKEVKILSEIIRNRKKLLSVYQNELEAIQAVETSYCKLQSQGKEIISTSVYSDQEVDQIQNQQNQKEQQVLELLLLQTEEVKLQIVEQEKENLEIQRAIEQCSKQFAAEELPSVTQIYKSESKIQESAAKAQTASKLGVRRIQNVNKSFLELNNELNAKKKLTEKYEEKLSKLSIQLNASFIKQSQMEDELQQCIKRNGLDKKIQPPKQSQQNENDSSILAKSSFIHQKTADLWLSSNKDFILNKNMYDLLRKKKEKTIKANNLMEHQLIKKRREIEHQMKNLQKQIKLKTTKIEEQVKKAQVKEQENQQLEQTLTSRKNQSEGYRSNRDECCNFMMTEVDADQSNAPKTDSPMKIPEKSMAYRYAQTLLNSSRKRQHSRKANENRSQNNRTATLSSNPSGQQLKSQKSFRLTKPKFPKLSASTDKKHNQSLQKTMVELDRPQSLPKSPKGMVKNKIVKQKDNCEDSPKQMSLKNTSSKKEREMMEILQKKFKNPHHQHTKNHEGKTLQCESYVQQNSQSIIFDKRDNPDNIETPRIKKRKVNNIQPRALSRKTSMGTKADQQSGVKVFQQDSKSLQKSCESLRKTKKSELASNPSNNNYQEMCEQMEKVKEEISSTVQKLQKIQLSLKPSFSTHFKSTKSGMFNHSTENNEQSNGNELNQIQEEIAQPYMTFLEEKGRSILGLEESSDFQS